ncbi:hypothetical protein CL618_00475 [archaeon]|nr:hypothetical protein [archaeon]|tara:strand:+ start:2648 stop:3991 length:1344 start_codon:yes stop_codon:yes gene_type:complete
MKRVVILLMFLLLINVVNADYSIKVVNNDIKYVEEAEFVLYVTNPDVLDKAYLIEFFSDNFELFAERNILVKGGETEVVDVMLKPTGEVKETNKVDLILKSSKEEIVSFDVNVDSSDMVYVNLEVSKEIDPKEDVIFTLKLKNNGKKDLKDVNVKINCDVCEESSLILDLGGSSELSKQGKLKIDSTTKPGLYDLGVEIWKNNLIGSGSSDLYVIMSSDIEKIEEKEEKFLVNILKIGRENKGNFLSEGSLRLEVSGLRKYFTKFYPEPDRVEGSENVWDYKINVNNKFVITAVSDYRLLVLVLLVLVLVGLIIVYYKTRKIVVIKYIKPIKEGKIVKGLKVFLVVKNKDKLMRNVSVFDYIPVLISLNGNYGTIKPSKVEKGNKFNKIKWDILKLDKWEERVLSYEIKSRLHIFGRLLLPRSVLKYRDRKGKIRKVKSNFLNVRIR